MNGKRLDFSIIKIGAFLAPSLVILIVIDFVTNGRPYVFFSDVDHFSIIRRYAVKFFNKYIHYVVYIIYLILLLKAVKRKNYVDFRFVIYFIIVQILVSFFLVHALKFILGAPRPVSGETQWMYFSFLSRYNSLPSGHTTEIILSCACLSLRKGILSSTLLGLIPACVIFSRIYVNAHHSIDIALGIILGIAGTYWMMRLFERSFLNLHSNEQKSLEILSCDENCQVRRLNTKIDIDIEMIVSNFVQGNFTVDTVLKRTESRFVGLIRETTGRPLVVKVENNPINRFEKAFYFTFFGSFTQRLFLEQNRAVRDGCVLIANVYLAIEKQSWFFPREILLVLDYFPGKVLEEFMDGGRGFGGLDGYADKIRDVFAELHRHKISMIDVNAANIIVEDDGGLKCIDLAHIYPFFFGRVVDIVKVERRLGVKVPSSGRLESIILALAKFQRSLLEFSRRHRIIGS